MDRESIKEYNYMRKEYYDTKERMRRIEGELEQMEGKNIKHMNNITKGE